MYRKFRKIWSIKGHSGNDFKEDREGATAIEFAILAVPFFTLAFGIIEIGLAHFANRLVDNAVVEASRLIRTGQAQSGNLSAAGFKTAVCDALPGFMCDEERIVVDINSIDDFADASSLDDLYDDEGNLREDTAYDIGGGSEIVVVNVIYRWPMITAILEFDETDEGYIRHLTSTMVFRNEPFE